MKIVVYSKPLCVQCDATKRELRKAGADFEVVDVTQDAEALEAVKRLGFASAPVVVAGESVWSGFRIDRIREALAAQAQQLAVA